MFKPEKFNSKPIFFTTLLDSLHNSYWTLNVPATRESFLRGFSHLFPSQKPVREIERECLESLMCQKYMMF